MRCSTATKAAISPAASASGTSVSAEAQPERFAFTQAYTSSANPVVTVTVPVTSNDRRDALGSKAGSTRTPTTTAAAERGTLKSSTADHPSASLSAPPTSAPAGAPAEPQAPQIAKARFRSRPSGNSRQRLARALGETRAAPTPCTARAATSQPALGARPPASDAVPNTSKPTTKIRRGPSTVPSRAPRRRRQPNVSV